MSPRHLQQLLAGLSASEREQAFAPKAVTLPLTDILLDAWALTTPNKPIPGRPEVAAYLHGLEQDPPETYIAWRREVTLLAEAKLDAETVAEWFQACRIEGRERLRDQTERVKRSLRELLKAHRKAKGDEQFDFRVVVLNERGEVEGIRDECGELRWPLLSEIVEQEFKLAYRTVVLPVEAGGLDEHGVLSAKQTNPAMDIADATADNRRERWLERSGADGPPYQRLRDGTVAEALPLPEQVRITLEEPAEDTGEGGCWLLLLTCRWRIEHRDNPHGLLGPIWREPASTERRYWPLDANSASGPGRPGPTRLSSSPTGIGRARTDGSGGTGGSPCNEGAR